MSVAATTPDATTVVLTVDLALGPDEAYAAFTDVATFAEWFWPDRLQPTYAIDPAVDGTLHARSDVADLGVTATFREIEQTRIVLDWRWDGASDSTTVTIAIEPADVGSRLVLTHSDNADESARDQHRQGWTDCLDRLAQLTPAED